MLETKIFLIVLLGLLSDVITFDSSGESYDTLLNSHMPSWSFGTGDNKLESSFQEFFPFFKKNYDYKSFHWPISHFKPLLTSVKPPPPVQPSPPIQPTPSSSQSQSSSSTREWPSWIPPIRLIKLPLDEPPAAIQDQNSLSLYYNLDDF